PEDIRPVEFDQRDSTYFDLVSELAIIGTKYYIGSTISQAASLINAAQQSNNENAKLSWARLAAHKKEVLTDEFSRVMDIIKGVTARPLISRILSEDPEDQVQGIAEYNEQLRKIAYIIESETPTEIQVASREVRTRVTSIETHDVTAPSEEHTASIITTTEATADTRPKPVRSATPKPRHTPKK
ncbi:unnamed protein product, partial [Didymodactylos carnosus]